MGPSKSLVSMGPPAGTHPGAIRLLKSLTFLSFSAVGGMAYSLSIKDMGTVGGYKGRVGGSELN